ncbi:MAG: type II toxin-antitoxin system HicA family toxin [Planctomycetes bacterium]|nr:type II toxin-antitoxin system HicA family toxin [Planctomycetota bacterium]
MARLPRVSGRDVVKALGRLGFERVRQRGSHVSMQKILPGGFLRTVVPMHRELATGTLADILRQSGVSADELRAHL